MSRATQRWLGLALVLGACRPEAPDAEQVLPPAVVVDPSPAKPLRVLYSGCREVREGPTCMLEPGGAELRLWAEVDPELGTTVWIDDVRVDATPEVVDDGMRWRVEPPPSARRLELRAGLGTPARFTLALELRGRPRASALERIAARPDLDDARLQLRALLPALEGEARALALQLAGDLASLTGDLDGMLDGYTQGAQAAAAVGWRRDASTLAQRVAFVCLELRYDERCVQHWLERDASFSAGDPEQHMLHAYYRGLQAEHVGDLRSALEFYRSEEREARALGLEELEAGALAQQLLLVGRLGAHERARALRQRAQVLEASLHPLLRGQLLNAAAWMMLEARGRGLDTEDPEPSLKLALALLGEEADVTSMSMRQAILLNLAYAAVLDGRAAAARAWLEPVDEAWLDHEDRLWLLLLRTRVAGLEDDPRAARRGFEALLIEADRLREPELRWLALVGQGETFETLGLSEPAQASYAAAEALLEEQLPRVAQGEGRERFVAERDRGARRLVDLLLRRGHAEAASCAARLARTRPLRTLTRQLRGAARAYDEQRAAMQRYRETRARLELAYDASWALPAAAARQEQRALERQRSANQAELDRLLAELDPGSSTAPDCAQLSAPGEGELHLHYMALDDGWVGFGVDDHGITAHRLGAVAIDEAAGREAWPRWSAALLQPFAAQIGRARRIRVMPSGVLTRVPFQALPAPSEPSMMLLDLAPVSYGLDLPRAQNDDGPSEPSAGEGSRVAMVVAPPSNLPHARTEARATRAALLDAGWEVRSLEGDAARGQAVRAALPQVDLMHYVGHARSDGLSGWDSTLALARGDTLDVGDVLSLSRAPATVVLDGCETGLADPQALAGGMSLAHAFVLAGSRRVIANTGIVDDAAAAALMLALHEALASGEATSAEAALRSAQQQRRAHDDGWLFARAFVP